MCQCLNSLWLSQILELLTQKHIEQILIMLELINQTSIKVFFHWSRNDITVDGFDPGPVSPRPFVCALSSRLGEEGRIMQKNNGAPLCQLAPIRRTYRLCQNRRRPNSSTVPLTWETESFIKEASMQRHLPLNCTQSNKAVGVERGGLGAFVVYSPDGNMGLVMKKASVWFEGDPIQERKRNKEETHSSSKA